MALFFILSSIGVQHVRKIAEESMRMLTLLVVVVLGVPRTVDDVADDDEEEFEWWWWYRNEVDNDDDAGDDVLDDYVPSPSEDWDMELWIISNNDHRPF